jgi:metal-responsive CopG/Arc/MetJ family transcriptional regulator
MAERKTEVLQVPVPKQVLEAVDLAANASWTSRSEFVRRAVMKDLEAKGFAPTHDEAAMA